MVKGPNTRHEREDSKEQRAIEIVIGSGLRKTLPQYVLNTAVQQGPTADGLAETIKILGAQLAGVAAVRPGLAAAELDAVCRDAIAANAKALAEFKAGKDSAINAFKGPVMKAAKGKANPKLVDETLRRLLADIASAAATAQPSRQARSKGISLGTVMAPDSGSTQYWAWEDTTE